MLKFKMSLLFNNLKFRVAMIMLLLATIVAGIILIPKNKAGNLAQEVNVKANETGIVINGKDLYAISKDGDAEGYNNILCIEEDAHLGYKTYSNPIEISKASGYFSNYNSAMWLLNNMYVTTTTGTNGLSSEVAKQVSAINFANLLTTNSVKQAIISKTGVDYTGVTPQKIYNLRNKTIDNSGRLNALQAVEQIALWKYTKNQGNTFSSAYANNPLQYLNGANLSADEQVTLKYVYYALINIADSKSGTPVSTSVSNCVVLNKKDAKFDANKYQVGPYYIESNGMKLTSYSFGNVANAAFPVGANITKMDGSTVTAGAEIFTKNPDGSFYINLNSYKDAKKVNFSIKYIMSNISTVAFVMDGGDKQNLLTIDKSIGASSLNDTKEITIPGQYSIELKKVKKDGTTVITSSEAEFKINGKTQLTSKGILNIATGKKIENPTKVDSYEISETKAPQGYNPFKGILKLTVGFKQDGNKYIIDDTKTKGEGFTDGTKMEVSTDKTKITIYVPNEEQPGKYNVELYKVDENGELIKSTAKFDINGTEKETKSGILEIASNVEVKDENREDEYKIKETQEPYNYNMFEGTITLKVKMTKTDKGFVLEQKNVKLDVGENNPGVSFKLDGTTIKVYVPNARKEFDLALRKFISKINGIDVEPSREPIINSTSISMLVETGTASYYHTKNSVSVNVGDEVEYTIRVYNEGEILGYAKQITDYLPEGLSFVKLSDSNSKEFTTTSEPGSKKVVINYSGNTTIKSLRDFIGKLKFKVTNEYYQEVKMICKVEDTEKVYITNRAEMTNYGYNEKDENDNDVWKEAKQIKNVDKDSVQNTISNELNLDTWYENAKERTYTDNNGKTIVDKNYYPGAQDDDDFETVELLTGKYNIIIKKVDSTDEKTTLSGAYFSVKGSCINDKMQQNNDSKESTIEVGPTNTNGEVTLVKGIKISNDKQVDSYIIKETKAPEGYKIYDGEIKISIGTKFNGKNYVINSENIKIEGKDIKYSVNDENTTITVIVPNTPKQFDLALRKFIIEVNGKELTETREPQVDVSKLVSGESTTATYNHSKNPIDVNTKDVVTYTLRVYNESEVDGYASKIMDDIPDGLEFIPGEYDKEGKPTNTNAYYGWLIYREVKSGELTIPENVIQYNGKEYVITDNAKEADVIVTDYLSKENGTDNLLKAFDSKTMKELDYKDVKVSFKVTEPNTSDRIIINYAQVTENTDSNGKPTTDRDSTPNKWIDGEDDQDIEKIKVRYFDLSLLKWVTKAIVYENGVPTVTETKHTPYDNPEPIVKVDLKNTNIDNVEVKFEYSIRITNEGEIAGYAKEISDYIPQGLKFIASDNPQWTEKDGKVVTRALENTLLQPGEHADVKIILTWVNGKDNLGLKVNTAEISEDYNDYGTPDIDSTPNNKVPGEDDIDDAPVMLSIRTGKPVVYAGITIAVLVMLTTGVVVIRKRVL